jgi:hypothetical protein
MVTLQNESGLARGQATERLIAWLTLFFGMASGCTALALRRRDWAAGLVLGAALAWLNFRWLARGLDALVAASVAQRSAPTGIQNDRQDGQDAPRPKAQVPLGTYFTALFRYGLIGLCVYVIFAYLHLPLGSLIVGLCALGAATIVASVLEILRPAG